MSVRVWSGGNGSHLGRGGTCDQVSAVLGDKCPHGPRVPISVPPTTPTPCLRNLPHLLPPAPTLEQTPRLLITSPHLPRSAISSGPDGEGQQRRRHQQEIPWEQREMDVPAVSDTIFSIEPLSGGRDRSHWREVFSVCFLQA